jgi:hypothetical protein
MKPWMGSLIRIGRIDVRSYQIATKSAGPCDEREFGKLARSRADGVGQLRIDDGDLRLRGTTSRGDRRRSCDHAKGRAICYSRVVPVRSLSLSAMKGSWSRGPNAPV